MPSIKAMKGSLQRAMRKSSAYSASKKAETSSYCPSRARRTADFTSPPEQKALHPWMPYLAINDLVRMHANTCTSIHLLYILSGRHWPWGLQQHYFLCKHASRQLSMADASLIVR
eukprot:scaffold68636_cov17-Tisochrysis_lutea.AAC.3